jgi:hypothetical protein
MKSLFIAGVLLALFAWIHADKPRQVPAPESYNNQDSMDTTPNKSPLPMNKKKDSPGQRMEFKDISSMKKSHDSSYRKKMLDMPLPK